MGMLYATNRGVAVPQRVRQASGVEERNARMITTSTAAQKVMLTFDRTSDDSTGTTCRLNRT